jgi:hypothetical protein
VSGRLISPAAVWSSSGERTLRRWKRSPIEASSSSVERLTQRAHAGELAAPHSVLVTEHE